MLPLALIALVVGLVQPAFAANDYFGITNAPGTGYDLSNKFWTVTSETTTPLAAFVAGDAMVIGANPQDFNGSNYTINLDSIGGGVGGSTLSGGAITIGSTNTTIVFSGTVNTHFGAATTISVAQGSTLIWSNTGNNGGFNFNKEAMTFLGAGTNDFRDTFMANDNVGGVTMNMTNGTIRLAQTATSNFGSTNGITFTLANGTLDFMSATALADAFQNFISTNTFAINGGFIDNLSGAAGTINLGDIATAPAGGVGKYSIGGNFTFIGSSSLSFNTNFVTLTVSPAITVAQNTLTIGGVISGSGDALTKAGAGTLILSAANTYTGNTLILGGTLALSGFGSLSASSAILVSNATFDISSLTGNYTTGSTIGITNGAFNLGAEQATGLSTLSISNATLSLAVNPNLTNIVAGVFTTGGSTNIISFTSPGFSSYPTNITLIKYTSAVNLVDGNNNLLNLGLANPLGSFGYLTNNQSASAVQLVLLSGPPPIAPITWNGQANGVNNGNWDILATTNWVTSSGRAPYPYQDGSVVTFDDTLAGTPNVNLTTTLSPASITFKNVNTNYVLSGSGQISGATALNVLSAGNVMLAETGNDNFSGGILVSNGTLVIDNNNSIAGGTTITNNGTVQVGNNDANGNLPTGNVIDNGTLVFNQSTNVTVNNIISGAGSVIQVDTNTLTLSGVNTPFAGQMIVLNGILKPNATTALGGTTAATEVTNNGTLDDNSLTFGQNAVAPLFVSGTGYNNLGAIINNGAAQTHAFSNITVTANVTFGGTNRWDIRANTGLAASLNTLPPGSPYKITKVGSNQISLVSLGTVDSGLGDIDVQQGMLGYESGTIGLGNSASNLFIRAGATLEFYQSTNVLNKVITVYGDGNTTNIFFNSGAGYPTNVIVGTIYLAAGGNAVVGGGAQGSLSNVISGPAGLIISSGRNVILDGVNTYLGNTIINSGTLTLSNNASIASSAQVIVNKGKFDLTGLNNNFTLAASQPLTLNGTNGGVMAASNLVLTASVITDTPSLNGDINASNLTYNSIGSLTIPQLPSFPYYPQTIPLINYGNFSGLFAQPGTLNLPAGFSGSLIQNGNSIALYLTVGPPVLTWKGQTNGVNVGNWDILGTSNWVLSSDLSTPRFFINGSMVTFDDNATGTTNVNLVTNVLPGAVQFNDYTLNYTLGGTGAISGTTGLNKQGSATVVLAESGGDNYSGGITMGSGTLIIDNDSSKVSGGTTINYGLLQVGNNDTNGYMPGGGITNYGELVFARTNSDLTVTNLITGYGAITNNGIGAVTLTAVESNYTGLVTANAGTLVFAAPNAVNSGIYASTGNGLVINSNATALLTNDNALAGASLNNTVPVTINAGGTLTGTSGRSSHIQGQLTINGGTLAMQGVQTGSNQMVYGTWDLGGGVVVNSGPNYGTTSVISCLNVIPMQGTAPNGTYFYVNPGNTPSGIDLLVSGSFANGTTTHDTGISITYNVNAGGVMALDNNNTYTGGITINYGTTLQLGVAGDTNMWTEPVGTGPVNISSGTLNLASGQGIVLTNSITGYGTLLASRGTNFLTFSNVYSGTVVVTGGSTLKLTGLGSLDSCQSFIVSNATLDVSGLASEFDYLNSGSANTLTLNGGTLNLGTNQANGPYSYSSLNLVNATLALSAKPGLTNLNQVNSLTTTGTTNLINVVSLPTFPFYPTNLTLITYYNPNNLTVGNNQLATLGVQLPALGGFTGYLTNNNNVYPSAIQLVLLSGPPPLTWNGQTNGVNDGNWDILQTTNWVATGSSAPYPYLDTSIVTFDDSLHGTTSVNLTTNLSPTTLTVNNVNSNYVFGGAGRLTGTTTLIKTGTGALTLTESNDNFSGGIVMGGGTLMLSNTAANLTGSLMVTNGTLTVAHGGTIAGGLTLDNSQGGSPVAVVEGSGSLSGGILAAGNLTVSNSPAISGGLVVSNGTALLDQSTTPSGALITTNGGLVQVGNSDALGNLPSGPITNNGALIFNRANNSLVVTNLISGNGGLTNIGTGTVYITNAVGEPFVGSVTVNAGTLALQGPNAAASTISASSMLTVNNGGTVQLLADNSLGNPTTVNGLSVTINAGGTLTGIGTANGGTGTSSHLRGLLILNGGTLAMNGTQTASHGSWNLDSNVVVLAGSVTSTIMASNVVPTETGGTVFNVATGTTPNGIDLLVSGTLNNASATHDAGYIKTGSGVMALDNNNTMTNFIAISNGVLQVGLPTDTAVLTAPLGSASGGGQVNNYSLLNFAGSQGANVARVISGTGTLLVGSGTNSLTASSTYTGNTLVYGGVLKLTGLGSINQSAFIAISNATLDASASTVPFINPNSITLTNGTLNLGTNQASALSSLAVSNSTLAFVVNAGAPNFVVTNFTTGGTTNLINITSVPGLTYPATITLVKYTAAANLVDINNKFMTLGLSLPVMSPVPAYNPVGYLTNNQAAGAIQLVLSSGPPLVVPITWNGQTNGVNIGAWDILNTADWLPTGGGSAYPYQDTSIVTFDDTLAGTANVNVTTNVSPGSITFNNNNTNYVFTGTGRIYGATSLNVQGSGTVTLAESGVDNFTGGVIVSNGTLIIDNTNHITGGTTITNDGTVQLGNNDATGYLPVGAVTDFGTLAFDRSDSNTVANYISGAGVVTKAGSGTLTVSNSTNSYTGGTVIYSGTVRPTGTNALGTGTVTVNSAGTLVENVNDAISNSVTLTGGTLGVSSAGSFTFGTNTVLTVTTNTMSIMMAADPQNPGTSENLYVNGVLSGGGNAIVMNATNVTSTDGSQGVRFLGTNGIASSFSGTIIVTNNAKCELDSSTAGPFSPLGTGNIILCAGEYDGNNTLNCTNIGGYLEFNIRNTAGTTTIPTSFQIAGTGAVVINGLGAPNGAVATLGNLTIGGGQELIGYRGGTGTTNTVNFPAVTLTGGNATFTPHSTTFGALAQAGTDLSLGAINQTAPSGIIMAGAGNLTLTGNNTYTGNTAINAGTVFLTGNGSLTNSAVITLASNATLNATGRSDQTLTLVSGQTFFGNGAINGNITNDAGSTMFDSGTVTGNFYCNGGELSPGANAGTIGTLTINGSVDMSLGGTTYMTLNKTNGTATNDLLVINGPIGYGGTLTVTNAGPALAAGDSFQLIVRSGTDFNTTFAVTNLPPLTAGLAWSNTITSDGKISVVGSAIVKQPPHIVSFTRSGTNLIFIGTNGVAGDQYIVWMSTNVALPLASWTSVLTNNFDNNGNFNFTNGIPPGSPRRFYIISQ